MVESDLQEASIIKAAQGLTILHLIVIIADGNDILCPHDLNAKRTILHDLIKLFTGDIKNNILIPVYIHDVALHTIVHHLGLQETRCFFNLAIMKVYVAIATGRNAFNYLASSFYPVMKTVWAGKLPA